jgi:hypothetical protein
MVHCPGSKNIPVKISFSFFSSIFLLYLTFLSSSAQKIDVLSYNIRYASFDGHPQNWDQRKEGVFSFLKGHDFIGLQEVLPVQIEEISQNPGNKYACFFRTREADPPKGGGVVRFYTIKLVGKALVTAFSGFPVHLKYRALTYGVQPITAW